MDEFEGIAVTNVRYSLDGKVMFIDLITGESIELHGKPRTRIVQYVIRRLQTRSTEFVLHNEEGPARISRRGHRTHRMWYLEGRRMSEKSWRKIVSGNVSMEDVIHESNAEVRMLLLRAMGPDKLVEVATLVDESTDECGRPRRLWEYTEKPLSDPEHRRWQAQPIKIRFIEVYNSSPPHERFMLYVPPEMKTAHEAVAWTFPYAAEGYEYNPDVAS